MKKIEKKDIIAKSFITIMEALWLDLEDKSLKETPKRIARMYVDEIFSWLDKETYPKIMTVPNWDNETVDYNQMVIVDNIKISTTCEHHFVPIDWVCHIAYIPNKLVMWLSKFARIVKYFSRKPQIQERLTEEIFLDLCKILETNNVAIIIKAKHFCMIARGVEEQNCWTTTSRMWGAFKNAETRAEFYNLLR